LKEDLHGLLNEEIRKSKITGMVYAMRSENREEWLQSNTCQLGPHHDALTESVMPQNKTHLTSNAADNNVPLHDM
jgi:hypothetical protein